MITTSVTEEVYIIAESCEFWEDYNNMTYVTIGAATNIVI